MTWHLLLNSMIASRMQRRNKEILDVIRIPTLTLDEMKPSTLEPGLAEETLSSLHSFRDYQYLDFCLNSTNITQVVVKLQYTWITAQFSLLFTRAVEISIAIAFLFQKPATAFFMP